MAERREVFRERKATGTHRRVESDSMHGRGGLSRTGAASPIL
jgi:hypothetical protein